MKHELKLCWLCAIFIVVVISGCGPTPAVNPAQKPADAHWTQWSMNDSIVTLHYYPPNGEQETYENAVIEYVGGEYGTVWFKDSEGFCVHGSYKVEIDPATE